MSGRTPNRDDHHQTQSARGPKSKLPIARGELRGRLVLFTEQEQLRPTPARVREAVFSMLLDITDQAAFLDACAGSGIMGFTALSCGYGPVMMVESNRAIFDQLASNRDRLGVDIALHYGSALQVNKLKLAARQWICYADPPFAEKKFHGKMMARLAALPAFEIGSFYVAEHETPLETPAGYSVFREKRYGRILITVFEKQQQLEPQPAEEA